MDAETKQWAAWTISVKNTFVHGALMSTDAEFLRRSKSAPNPTTDISLGSEEASEESDQESQQGDGEDGEEQAPWAIIEKNTFLHCTRVSSDAELLQRSKSAPSPTTDISVRSYEASEESDEESQQSSKDGQGQTQGSQSQELVQCEALGTPPESDVDALKWEALSTPSAQKDFKIPVMAEIPSGSAGNGGGRALPGASIPGGMYGGGVPMAWPMGGGFGGTNGMPQMAMYPSFFFGGPAAAQWTAGFQAASSSSQAAKLRAAQAAEFRLQAAQLMKAALQVEMAAQQAMSSVSTTSDEAKSSVSTTSPMTGLTQKDAFTKGSKTKAPSLQ